MPSATAQGTGRAAKPKLFSKEFLASRWAKLFFFVVGMQALIGVVFEAYGSSDLQTSFQEFRD